MPNRIQTPYTSSRPNPISSVLSASPTAPFHVSALGYSSQRLAAPGCSILRLGPTSRPCVSAPGCSILRLGAGLLHPASRRRAPPAALPHSPDHGEPLPNPTLVASLGTMCALVALPMRAGPPGCTLGKPAPCSPASLHLAHCAPERLRITAGHRTAPRRSRKDPSTGRD